MKNKKLVAIGLGTNIEPRMEYFKDAIQKIDEMDEVIRMASISSIYETDPIGYIDQAAFLNCVIFIETTFLPYELLEKLQALELELGRVRLIRWGPRTIDLDILVYEGVQMDDERLTIPHPRMHERAFVGVPFEEAYSELSEDEKQRVGQVELNLARDGIELFQMSKTVCRIQK